MNVPRMTRPVTVRTITSTTTDDYGNPVPVETSTAVLGHWRHLSADEVGPNTIPERSFRVHVPADTVVDAGSRVDLDGVSAEVIGTPHALYNPRTGLTPAVVFRAEVAA